jgi:hypothetical protein
LEVRGPEGIPVGAKVRVQWEGVRSPAGEDVSSPVTPDRFMVLLPLAFGGRDAVVRVEAFVEKGPLRKGTSRPVYFLVETETERVGKTQWGVHLKGRQVGLQVHATGGRAGSLVGPLVAEVEKRLTAAGFQWAHPVQWMSRPLRAPRGYGLSLRG